MSAEPRWLQLARGYLGTREVEGAGNNPKVVEFYRRAGHGSVTEDSVPWCAAFANAVLAEAGVKGTGALNARSFLKWGKQLALPRPGCIVVFKRGSSEWQGHVAFFLRDMGNVVEVLGGNQSNSVSIARYSKADFLGYRWPAEEPGAVPPPPDIAKPKPKPAAKPKSTVTRTGAAIAIGVGTATAAHTGVDPGLIVFALVGILAAAAAVIVFRKRRKDKPDA
jgi:uncharacterized protein (TIGR02594 family)